jgi:hypothetical protein
VDVNEKAIRYRQQTIKVIRFNDRQQSLVNFNYCGILTAHQRGLSPALLTQSEHFTLLITSPPARPAQFTEFN